MSEFSTSMKSQSEYIDLAANGNGSEKAMLTLRALSRLSENNTHGVHVVEIGPGGGAAVASVTRAISSDEIARPKELSLSLIELDGVESATLKTAREEFERHGESRLVKGDARHLHELIPTGADIIAASSVLHEVYSYAGGYTAIDQTISAITDTLNPNGFFAYRDVFSVDRTSHHDCAKHVYDVESWVRFAKLFLPYYLKNAQHPYHREEDKVLFEQDSQSITADDIDPDKYLSIKAPIGLLRELQRHYITLRDYVWRQGVLGVTPVLEGRDANDWLDMKSGHKRVHYRTSLDDKLLDAMSEETEDGYKVVDGDTFDSTTDVLLARFLQQVANGNNDSSAVWQEWLLREGSETYIYMTVGNLLGAVALKSLEASNGKKILLPVDHGDVFVRPRAYYNRFLQGQLSNPLFDGKQLVLFQAIDPDKNPDKIVRSLDVIGEHCTKTKVGQIYGPIRKVIY